MMADIFNITVGQTFSGGFIDYILFGVLQGNSKTNYLWVIPIGIVWFCLYYIIFRFLIIKFNFKTPDVKIKNKLKVLKLRNVLILLSKV